MAPEREVRTAAEAVAAGGELGFPVVLKLCGDAIAHKTERGLVRLKLGAPWLDNGSLMRLLPQTVPRFARPALPLTWCLTLLTQLPT